MLKSARKEGKQQRDPEGRMPLAEHLRELRNRLMKAVLAILAVSVVAMIYYKQIADFLTEPVLEAVGCDESFGKAENGEVCADITIQGFVAPFTIMLKVALTTGLVVASPVWLYQLWAFLAPGLHQQEKKYAYGFVAAGAPLFLGGAWLAYIILPTAAKTLLDFSPEGTSNLIPLDDFLDIITRLVIVFGLAFELPLLLVMLNFGGIVKGRQLLGWWRFMVIGIAVFSAVATPTGDPLTMAALAVPIVLLYFAAVGVCFFNDRRRRRSDPYAGLDDDEASDLDLTPEPVAPAGAAPEPGPAPERDGSSARNGYDDAT
ncbi:twin-arginine translocase subunit TatC [Streptomyces sp. N2-109]|uniref:Sec-independent protein translocase protein TatC n=1 Tax=Streptomyces gossypii TaxID=2883101 RepID=A0ABT2JN52_9ACTN|nr:twin-arginine translocase subunit TatC [Streptomyces gossypii]MCT2588699.1 twin-arginine translocase subunit TatC [Streptomyces gossypii]